MNLVPEALLVGAVVGVGVLHTVVPDHWVPITLIARQNGWSRRETAEAAFKAGTGHVVSTLLIGLVVWDCRRRVRDTLRPIRVGCVKPRPHRFRRLDRNRVATGDAGRSQATITVSGTRTMTILPPTRTEAIATRYRRRREPSLCQSSYGTRRRASASSDPRSALLRSRRCETTAPVKPSQCRTLGRIGSRRTPSQSLTSSTPC